MPHFLQLGNHWIDLDRVNRLECRAGQHIASGLPVHVTIWFAEGKLDIRDPGEIRELMDFLAAHRAAPTETR